MDLLEDVAAVRAPDVHKPPHVVAHLRRRAVEDHVACVAAAAPEGEPAAEIALQALRFHPAAGDLHRVDRIEPGGDEAGE